MFESKLIQMISQSILNSPLFICLTLQGIFIISKMLYLYKGDYNVWLQTKEHQIYLNVVKRKKKSFDI